MLASEQGSIEIVQELIRRGANVNLDDVVSRRAQWINTYTRSFQGRHEYIQFSMTIIGNVPITVNFA